jgi:hypothetical protein
MKVAMPLVRRALDLAESNPALFVVIASLSVPLALIYAALSFVTAPAINLLAFLGLGVLALSYAGWLARLAITHWGSAAVNHCGG